MGLTLATILGIRNLSKEITSTDSVKEIFESFQTALLSSLDSCVDKVKSENRYSVEQLKFLFRQGEGRKLIKQFFQTELDIQEVNQLITGKKGTEGLAKILVSIAEKHVDNANIDIELSEKIIKEALLIFNEAWLNSLSVKQGNAISIIQGATNAESLIDIQKSIESGFKNLSGGLTVINEQQFSEKYLTPIFQKDINKARGLLNSNKPEDAIEILKELKERFDATPLDDDKILASVSILFSRAYSLLKNEDLEIKYSTIAVELAPDNIGYLYNFANVLHLTNRQGEFPELIKKIEGIDPSANQAVALKLLTEKDPIVVDKIISKLSKSNLKSVEVLFAASRVHSERGNVEKRIFYLEKASRLFPKNKDVKLELAFVLSHLQGREIAPAFVPKLSEEGLKNVKKARKLYKELWDYYKKTPLKKENIDLLMNISILDFILGKSENAHKKIDECIKVKKDADYLKYHKVLYLYQEHKIEQAVELCKNMDLSKIPDGYLLFAELCRKNGTPQETIKALEGYAEKHETVKKSQNAQRLLIITYLEGEELDKAKSALTKYKKNPFSEISVRYLQIRIDELEGKKGIISALDDVSNFIVDNTHISDLIDIAEMYYLHCKWRKATKIYNRIADNTTSTHFHFRLLDCWLKLGNWEKVISLCQSFKQNFKETAEYSLFEISALVRLKKYEIAKLKGAELIEKNPDSTHIKLQIFKVCVLSNDEKTAEEILDSAPKEEFTKEVFEDIVFAYNESENARLCLKWSFEYRNRFDCADAHIRYWQVFFRYGKQLENHTNTPSKVENETSVTVVIDGDIENTYLLSNRENYKGKDTQIIEGNHVYHKLIDRTLEEEFVWVDRQPFIKRAKITAIKTKWLHAYHETLHKLEIKFFDEKPFQSFPSNIETIEKQLDQNEVYSESVENLLEVIAPNYKQGIVPIAIIAKKINRTFIEAFEICRTRTDWGIRCNIDNTFSDNAIDVAKLNGIATDISGLLTFYNLKIGEELTRNFGKIRITPAVYHEVMLAYTEAKINKESDGFHLIRQNGQTFRNDIPQEQIHKRFTYFNELKKWVDSYCEILDIGGYGLEFDKVERIEKFFGQAVTEVMQLCEQGDYTFFSSEASIRFLYSQNSNVPVLWIIPLLVHFVKNKTITPENFLHYQTNLIIDNYSFIGISDQTLFAAAESGSIKKFKIVMRKFVTSGVKHDVIIKSNTVLLLLFRRDSTRNPSYQKAITHSICDFLIELIEERNKEAVFDFIKITVKGMDLLPLYLIKEIIADIDERAAYYKGNE